MGEDTIWRVNGKYVVKVSYAKMTEPKLLPGLEHPDYLWIVPPPSDSSHGSTGFRREPFIGGVQYTSVVTLANDQVGLNLLRQLVRGSNSLRTLEVFPCNQAEHEDVDCKCFWEQCEAWAKQDATTPAPSNELLDEVQHRMDQVVESAVEWHQAGREGDEWFDKAEALGAAIESLLELRSKPEQLTPPK